MSSKVLLTFVHNFWWGVDFWTRSTSSVNQKEILNTYFIYFQFKLKIKYFTVQWNDNTGEVENNPKIHMSCINGKDKILFSLYQSIREENKIISKDKNSVCHLEETRSVVPFEPTLSLGSLVKVWVVIGSVVAVVAEMVVVVDVAVVVVVVVVVKPSP